MPYTHWRSFVVSLVFVAVHAVAQCEPEWRAASSYAGVRGRVDVAEPWDPDGAGPMAPGLVVGGNFEYAGDARVRYVAFYDEVARAFRPIGTGTNGVVSAAVALPGGGLVIGGAFNEAGGAPCSRIARWDGQAWSPLGAGLDGAVEALAVLPNGDVVAGGRFTQAGGIAAQRIARWDGASWSPLPGGALTWPNTDARVEALAVLPNGDLAVGGWFTIAGTTVAVGLARHDGAGWSTFGAGLNSGVDAIEMLPNGDMIAGGWFGTAGGVVARGIARWDGSNWSAFGAGVSSGLLVGRVWTVAALPNGDIVAGGRFETAGTVQADSLARWDGNRWHPMGVDLLEPIVSGVTSALVVTPLANGDLYLGGYFGFVDGKAAFSVARWDGATWTRAVDGIDLYIGALARGANGDLYAGGRFRAIGGSDARFVARWDGTTWHALGAGVDDEVTAIATLPNGDVVVAGRFSTAGNAQAQTFARWDGQSWYAMPGLIGYVWTLYSAPDGELYAGGNFPGGIARRVGNAWQLVGGGVSFQPPATTSAFVQSIAELPNGDLVVSGRFDTAGSTPALRYARWDGSTWHDMDDGTGTASVAPARAMQVLPNGDLAVAGTFQIAGVPTPQTLVRWDGTFWQPFAGGVTTGDLSALHVLPGGDLMVAGIFTSIGGVPAESLARWDGSGWAALPGVQAGGVLALAELEGGRVAVAGAFVEAAGAVSPHFAVLEAPCAASVADLGGGCSGSGGANVLAAEQLPWAGGSFDARGTGLAPTTLVAAVYGFTPTSLPLANVLPQALPGCDLQVSPDLVEFAVGTAGEVVTSLPIPAAPALTGVDIFHQLVPIEVDQSLNITAVTASNVLRATLGVF